MSEMNFGDASKYIMGNCIDTFEETVLFELGIEYVKKEYTEVDEDAKIVIIDFKTDKSSLYFRGKVNEATLDQMKEFIQEYFNNCRKIQNVLTEDSSAQFEVQSKDKSMYISYSSNSLDLE